MSNIPVMPCCSHAEHYNFSLEGGGRHRIGAILYPCKSMRYLLNNYYVPRVVLSSVEGYGT